MNYEVGYKNSPKENQFKKGHIPHNREKKKSYTPNVDESVDIYAAVAKVTSRKVGTTGRRRKTMPAIEVLLNQTLNDALRGDAKARDQILKLSERAYLATSDAGEHIRVIVSGGLPEASGAGC